MVNKNEWSTKEGPGKSIKNALYIQQHGRRQLLGWSDIEQQKNQAKKLSICLSGYANNLPGIVGFDSSGA